MSKFGFGRARGVRYSQPLRFEELEDRCMLSLTGDAPSPYPTASHNSGAASRLGDSQTVDDGVVISSIRAGQLSVAITVDVQGNSSGRLDAWIDFNRDGSFSGPWEQIVNNDLLSSNDIHTITFDVPSWAEVGSTWARFRISTGSNMPVGSSEPNGETEDYSLTILAPADSRGMFGSQQVVDDAAGTATAARPVFGADFDGDGDTDLVSATSSDNSVAWHRNNGDNTFTRFTVGTANDPRSVFTADVDGDDLMDILAVSVTDNSVYWYRNDGTPATGAWTRSTVSNTASGARAVQAADIDRDGDIDVIAASYLIDKVAWYENNGSQTFTERIVNVPDVDTNSSNGNGDVDGPSAVFVADIDRDGHLDIVSASGVDGEVVWYQNDGTPATGAWTQRTIRTSVAATADPAELSVVVADMNGDGGMDIVTANFSEDRIAWFENDGTPASGTWTRRNISTTANGAYTVFAADVDSDGDMDVLSASVLDDKIALYQNNGNGIVFTATTINTADPDANPSNAANGNADGATHVFAADLNGDGDLDVVSGSRNDNKVAWYSNLNDPGIVITQVNNPLQVSETGTTDTFTVALASQPTSNVVLQILSSDLTGEATVSVASLTFTSSNWMTPQTVTVTGLDESVDDGNQTRTITVRVNDASSASEYDPLADVPVSVITTDNDTADFTITQTGGNTQVGEPNTTDTFTVVLTSQPTSNVVIEVIANDTGEATVSPMMLTFTTANWNVARTVTVTGADDQLVDGTQTSTIFVRVVDASSDNTYDLLPDKTISVTTTDNEVADFTVTPTGGSTSVSESATTDDFSVVLTAQPASNVVFTIFSSDTGEATVSPTTLTFTNANWNIPQSVTVTGVNDSILDGTQTSTITIRVNDASSDNSFDPLADKTVSVTTTDNDTSPPGDYDDDGIVNNNDYNTWRRNFGSTAAAADGNGDGVVDAADYVVWRKLFGTSGISGSGAGGGGEAGLSAALAESSSNDFAIENAVADDSKSANLSVVAISPVTLPRSRSTIAHVRGGDGWRYSPLSGKLHNLAAALAATRRTADAEFQDSDPKPVAASTIDAAFASEDLLEMPAEELLVNCELR